MGFCKKHDKIKIFRDLSMQIRAAFFTKSTWADNLKSKPLNKQSYLIQAKKEIFPKRFLSILAI